ncbi:hypothetical protein, partial [Salmonella enterica]|uniref:hypothetical protein n=1 Tax=Salmonella enterica TaxID=28901 RepID=UPI00398C70F6
RGRERDGHIGLGVGWRESRVSPAETVCGVDNLVGRAVAEEGHKSGSVTGWDAQSRGSKPH